MCGAGDTVVAMMISCLASGYLMRLALHIANGAAGIVVSLGWDINPSPRVDRSMALCATIDNI